MTFGDEKEGKDRQVRKEGIIDALQKSDWNL